MFLRFCLSAFLLFVFSAFAFLFFYFFCFCCAACMYIIVSIYILGSGTMGAYVHIQSYTYIPTCLLTYLHTSYIHTDLHTDIHTYTLTYIHTYLSTYLDTYIQIYIRTYRQTEARTRIQTFEHTCIHTDLLDQQHEPIHTSLSINYLYNIRVANWWTKFASSWCCFLSGRNGEQNFGDVWSGNREGAGSLFLGDDCCGSLLIRLLML